MTVPGVAWYSQKKHLTWCSSKEQAPRRKGTKGKQHALIGMFSLCYASKPLLVSDISLTRTFAYPQSASATGWRPTRTQSTRLPRRGLHMPTQTSLQSLTPSRPSGRQRYVILHRPSPIIMSMASCRRPRLEERRGAEQQACMRPTSRYAYLPI